MWQHWNLSRNLRLTSVRVFELSQNLPFQLLNFPVNFLYVILLFWHWRLFYRHLFLLLRFPQHRISIFIPWAFLLFLIWLVFVKRLFVALILVKRNLSRNRFLLVWDQTRVQQIPIDKLLLTSLSFSFS